MKTKRPRYQQGSISKAQRAAGGFVWKVRFSEQRNGERFQRTLTLDGAKYPTELVALQWQDIDWKNKEITIQRKFTHGALGKTKTVASDANLPL